MDRRTLMGYGWVAIVSCLLVVMIMLATPFGKFIASAFRSTTEGFYQVEKEITEDGNIIIGGVVFDAPDEEGPKSEPIKITIDSTQYDAMSNTNWEKWANESKPDTFTVTYTVENQVKINDKYVISKTDNSPVLKTDIISSMTEYYLSSIIPS